MIDDTLLKSVAGSLPDDITVAIATELENNVLVFCYNKCRATVGCGFTEVKGKNQPWATVYTFDTGYGPSKDAIYMTKALKAYFTSNGYDFAFSFADTAAIKGMLYALHIKERETAIGGVKLMEGVEWSNRLFSTKLNNRRL